MSKVLERRQGEQREQAERRYGERREWLEDYTDAERAEFSQYIENEQFKRELENRGPLVLERDEPCEWCPGCPLCLP